MGFYFLEQDGMFAPAPDTGKDYFFGRDEKNTFLDRYQHSLECGRNLFGEEWKEWGGYEEEFLY